MDFKGLLHASAFPVMPVAPFYQRDATMNGSGSISERMRNNQDLGESRQKPLDFSFLVEGE